MHVAHRPKTTDFIVTVTHPTGHRVALHTSDVDEARKWHHDAGPHDTVETEAWDDYLNGYVEADPNLGDW